MPHCEADDVYFESEIWSVVVHKVAVGSEGRDPRNCVASGEGPGKFTILALQNGRMSRTQGSDTE